MRKYRPKKGCIARENTHFYVNRVATSGTAPKNIIIGGKTLSMRAFRYSSPILLFVLSIFVTNFKPVKPGPAGLPNIRADDTESIQIDPNFCDTSCFKPILKELVSDQKDLFQQPMFNLFFASSETRLVFAERAFSWDTAAYSGRTRFDDNGIFRDTIFLNRYIFEKSCKEFLVSTIEHEILHSYIKWCHRSFKSDRDGIDTDYLRAHFPNGWERLTEEKDLSNVEQHSLMIKNYLGTMIENLFYSTNPQSNTSLRQEIAEALTWGGFCETPEWKQFSLDTCRIHSIDIWSRHTDAPETKGVHYGNCRDTTDIGFLRSLHLTPLCKYRL
jgi:hypothetical protein